MRQLAQLFQVVDLRIYKWMNCYKADGVQGLQNQPCKGRKPLLKLENQAHVQVVEEQIEKQLGYSLSERTLKRFLKKWLRLDPSAEPGRRSATLP